jgi:hypothetical protein
LPRKDSPKPFMTHRFAGALLKLRQDAPISIAGIPAARMVSYDRSYVSQQSLVVFAGASMVPSVVVGDLR